MKVESAEPVTDIHVDARIDSAIDSIGNLELTDVASVMDYQDLRASLAEINSYSHALKSIFQELKDQYGDVLEQKDGESDATSSDRLMSLDTDCRACLSRLCNSVDQLRQKLEVGGVLRNSTPD